MAEEVGLEGAKSIDGAAIAGRILLNLDSEEDGRLTTGCAGSTDTFLRLEAPREAPGAGRDGAGRRCRRRRRRPLGHQHRTRAAPTPIKVLARCLREALTEAPFRLASLDGGKSRNAIPRDARAVVLVAGSRSTRSRRR